MRKNSWDKILKIGGETTKNMPLIKAVQLMRGSKGSSATLEIMREGFKRSKNWKITRDVVRTQPIKRKQLIEPGYAYVKLAALPEKTDTDFAKAIDELGKQHPVKGLILDLRNNPGGLLDQAVKIANLFIDRGLIAYTDGRAKDQRMEFQASKTNKRFDFRVAILINKGTASGSEILASALQDHDRALILGTKSFGKASVQTIIPLEGGCGIRLTTAYYYTPKGRHIQTTGIVPDIDLQSESQEAGQAADLDKDVMFKKALDWLKSGKTVKEAKSHKSST